MVFTWVLGVVMAIYAWAFVDYWPPEPINFLSGFIAGALIDIVIRLNQKQKNAE